VPAAERNSDKLSRQITFFSNLREGPFSKVCDKKVGYRTQTALSGGTIPKPFGLEAATRRA